MADPEHCNKKHVIMFPYMAQSHLIAFAALAQLLRHWMGSSLTLTFVSTRLNIQRLRALLPPHTCFNFAELPFSSTDHGLPPDSENTNSIPPHLATRLLAASLSLQPAFDRLVSEICLRDGSPPLCIISDMLFSWSVEVAHKFGIFHSIFSLIGGYLLAVSSFVTQNLDVSVAPFLQSVKVQYPANENDPWASTMLKLFSVSRQSDGVLFNTVEEVEAKGLNFLRENFFKRAWAIGPILHPPSVVTGNEAAGSSRVSCIEWLNLHPPDSVLYISFGSENTINPLQMMELAKGLEASGKAFIWVLRPPIAYDITGDFKEEWLPAGFEDRVTKNTNKGLLMKRWAPQVDILLHKSTGGFLSHCGWNSTLESLIYGVPIIGWPLAWEQFRTSKMLEEELNVSVEFARGATEDVSGEEFVRVVGLVMDADSEKGKEMRKNVRAIAEVMKAATVEEEPKGSSVRAMEEFLQTAASWSQN